jgi:Lar family restriction alleviation protein
MASKREPLKPCPFCGQKPITTQVVGHIFFRVHCKNFDCSVNPVVHRRSESDVVKAWNTRKGEHDAK